MILIIGAWYNEVGYSFKFSHKVDNFIREKIKDNILQKYCSNEVNTDWYLRLIVATDSTIKSVEVRGPDILKRTKRINYGLWLPFKTIMNSNYPLETYINCLFEAMVIVFKNYEVPNEEIDKIKKLCRKEILNNIEYVK